MPAQHDLRGRLRVACCRTGDRSKALERQVAAKRAPTLGNDVVARIDVAEIALRPRRMELDLIDNRRFAGLAPQALPVILVEIADADGSDETFVAELDHRTP